MILEPVLGEGGYMPGAGRRSSHGLVERCRAHGILFVADEVQSGFGRTGEMFAVDHYGIEPDVICMAKGIASGFPFAALGTRRELDDRWPKGSHGGTYGGNPIGCAAALATLDVITAPGFLDDVRARGEQLVDGLRELQAHDAGIRQVRGLGLMVATELDDPARVAAIAAHCLREGHLILMNAGTDGTVLRWMPPLVVVGGGDRRGARRVRRRPQGDGLTVDGPARRDARVAAWRELQSVTAELERTHRRGADRRVGRPARLVRRARRAAAARRPARPSELAAELRLVRSSLSRRLDRLEEEGWVARRAAGGRRRPPGRRRRADPAGPGAVAGDERDVPPGRAGPRGLGARRRRRRRAAPHPRPRRLPRGRTRRARPATATIG